MSNSMGEMPIERTASARVDGPYVCLPQRLCADCCGVKKLLALRRRAGGAEAAAGWGEAGGWRRRRRGRDGRRAARHRRTQRVALAREVLCRCPATDRDGRSRRQSDFLSPARAVKDDHVGID
jgi:hypothetical protein